MIKSFNKVSGSNDSLQAEIVKWKKFLKNLNKNLVQTVNTKEMYCDSYQTLDQHL